jgi:hypothetical protein
MVSVFYLTTNRQQCNDCGNKKYYYNSKCIDEIRNCLTYSGEKECSQCLPGYKISDPTEQNFSTFIKINLFIFPIFLLF